MTRNKYRASQHLTFLWPSTSRATGSHRMGSGRPWSTIWLVQCIVIDQDHRIRYLSQLNPDFGYDDLLGHSILEFIDPRQHELYHETISRLNASKTAQSVEFDVAAVQGSTNWWSFNLSLLQLNDQTFYLCMAHNITQRQRIEFAQHAQHVIADTLRETLTDLTGTSGIPHIMERIVSGIARVVPHDRINVMFVRDNAAYVAYSQGYTSEQEASLRATAFDLQDPDFGYMISTRQPHLRQSGTGIGSYLGVPVIAQDEVIGFLNLHSTAEDFFTEQNAEHLQVFAEQVATVVQNAEVYANISRRADEMVKLQRATSLLFTSLSTAQSLEDMGLQIAQAAVEAFGLVDSGIILLNQDSGELKRLTRVGSYGVDAQHTIHIDGPGLVPAAASSGELIYAPDVAQDPRYISGDPRTRSELAIPLLADSRVIGVLDIQSSEKDAFSEGVQHLLIAFAERAATAIENVRLSAAIRRYTNELESWIVERTQEVYQLNEQLSTILDNTSDAILLLQGDGQIMTTNSALDEQFLYGSKELDEQPLLTIIDPDDHPAVQSLYAEVMADRLTHHGEVLARRKDGTLFEAEITLSHVQNDTDQVVCTLHDISRLKEIERMKDSFISTVSHELRTPIAAVVLLAEALNRHREKMSEEQLVRKLQQLHAQAMVLSEMVEMILDLSRVEAHTGQRGTQPVDMIQVVHNVVSELRSSAELKIQTLSLEAPAGSLVISGDYLDFTRIWRNLISNGIKYTPDAGQVTVRLVALGDSPAPAFVPDAVAEHRPCIVGQVEDTGHGIQNLDDLFKRFDRGWAQHSTIPGTGLGLPLVRDLLRIYGGDIHVSSVLNQGSIFTFWIPI